MSEELEQRLRRLNGSVSAAEERLDETESKLDEHVGRLDAAERQAEVDRDAVADLSAEFVQARDGLRAAVDQTKVELGETLREVQALQQSVAAGGASGSEETGLAHFESLLDADERRAPAHAREALAWAKQVGPMLRPRIQITLQCWPSHPVVVQALHDARIAWELVYREHGSIHDLTSWYDLWPKLHQLIEKDLKGCEGENGHREPTAYTDKDGWNIERQVEGELEHALQIFAARSAGRLAPRAAPAAPAGSAAGDDEETDDEAADDEAE